MSAASFRWLVAFLVVGAAALTVSSCGDDSGGQDTSSRESDVYAAIVSSVAAAETAGESTPVVYVAPLGNDKPIPLNVQVAVVDSVGNAAVVRFVDKADQAINQDDETLPVLDDAVLVRLGEVPESGASVEVPGELYRTKADSALVVYVVNETSNGWVVASTRAPAGSASTSAGS